MNGISSSQTSLLNAVISGYQTDRAITTAVMGKVKDAQQAQGDAALALIEGAIGPTGGGDTPTMGALASGLGQSLDISA